MDNDPLNGGTIDELFIPGFEKDCKLKLQLVLQQNQVRINSGFITQGIHYYGQFE